MTLILNVEGDEILYRGAFATEKQCYKLITKNGQTRDFGNNYTKTQILNKIKQIGIKDYILTGYKQVEPLEHTLHIIKRTLIKLQQIGEVKLWLSPSDGSNYRFGIVETPGPRGLGYKAGRPPRPIHYLAIRSYLINKWGAKEIQGFEADDALGMYQNENSVAVHIDKDINMIVGKHYNWVKSERYIVEEGIGKLPIDGNRGLGKAFFWFQMLTGDNTDNIPGIPKIGPVKAYKLLKDCKTEEEMFDIVREQYYNTYKEKSNEVLIEIANLLYIVDNENRLGQDYVTNIAINCKNMIFRSEK